PFSVDDAFIDFIITKQLPEENKSHVLVAAVQKNLLEDHLSLFASLPQSPDVVIVDFFALFGIYKHMPLHTQLTPHVALVTMNTDTTTIGYCENEQLRSIRTFPRGLNDIARTIHTKTDTPLQSIIPLIMKEGVQTKQTSPFYTTLQEELAHLWSDVALTMQTFINTNDTPYTLLLSGQIAMIREIEKYATTLTKTPCFSLHPHDLTQNKSLHITLTQDVTHNELISLGAALLLPPTDSCNLRQKDLLNPREITLFNYQIITGLCLTFLLFFSFISYNMWELRKLRSVLYQAKSDVVTILKKEFKQLKNVELETIEESINEAQRYLQKEKDIWSNFAESHKWSTLHYIVELTERIDKEELEFILDKLIIARNTMTIFAQVKNHNALTLLEKELKKSKLFLDIEGDLDEPTFMMKIKLAPIT
ncbi:MAG: pilus assembly protein PilM, partial [Candidatus Babeliales bacterium]